MLFYKCYFKTNNAIHFITNCQQRNTSLELNSNFHRFHDNHTHLALPVVDYSCRLNLLFQNYCCPRHLVAGIYDSATLALWTTCHTSWSTTTQISENIEIRLKFRMMCHTSWSAAILEVSSLKYLKIWKYDSTWKSLHKLMLVLLTQAHWSIYASAI